MFQDDIEHLLSRPITLLELKIHLESLMSQIQLIAYIIIKPYQEIAEYDRKMMERQEREINGPMMEGKSANFLSIDEQIEIEKPEKPTFRQRYWTKISQFLPLHQANFMLYDKSIMHMSKEEWFRDFPKGSHLLSYLYNILISLESDLSVIDLIRKLFQKTLSPYLTFITEFIYMGDFHDPFNEFYIKKLDPSRSGDKPMPDVNQPLSFTTKFAIRNGPSADIPIFLSRFALQIFKSGSALSLLKEVSASEYFEICSKSHTALLLPTPYDMRSLNTHCSTLSAFYYNQSEQLIDLEHLYSTREAERIILRSKIIRNYEEFQKKVNEKLEKEQEEKRSKQRKEMEIIQQQIAENQQRTEEEKKAKEEENKQIREQIDKEKNVEKQIVKALKDEYKRMFEGSVDMRDQEHIKKDEEKLKEETREETKEEIKEDIVEDFAIGEIIAEEDNKSDYKNKEEIVNEGPQFDEKEDKTEHVDMEVDIKDVEIELPDDEGEDKEGESPRSVILNPFDEDMEGKIQLYFS
jgi:hypothetical protein